MIDTVAYHLHLFYENFDYDFFHNGESEVLRKLATLKPRTIMDVGANVGDWALIAADLCPSATVHCFELIGPTRERLVQNTASKPNIIVNEFGLSNRVEQVRCKYYPGNSELSGIYDFPIAAKYQFVEARAGTGDDYLEQAGIERVDFLKIDVEGMEPVVLDGFSRSLEQRRIRVVQFEYGMANIVPKFLLRDFYALFEHHGFRVGKIYPRYVEFRALLAN